jgi:hypothetical protein
VQVKATLPHLGIGHHADNGIGGGGGGQLSQQLVPMQRASHITGLAIPDGSADTGAAGSMDCGKKGKGRTSSKFFKDILDGKALH